MSLRQEVERYSGVNAYPISDYEQIVCDCGHREFRLYSDDDEGGAFIQCTNCGSEHDILESRKYIEDQVHNICNCGNELFQIGIGKAFYEGTTETKWVYVGAFCKVCNLKGVYVDWKNT